MENVILNPDEVKHIRRAISIALRYVWGVKLEAEQNGGDVDYVMRHYDYIDSAIEILDRAEEIVQGG